MTQSPPPSIDDASGANAGAPTSTEEETRYRLAAAIRRIGEVVVGYPPPFDVVASAAEELDRIAQVLEKSATATRRGRAMSNLAAWPGDFRDILPTSPIIGFANPIAPPVELWKVEGEDGLPEIRGRVTYNHLYEGPPNCVHGGVVAELFDELMGIAVVVAERPAMTGTLTVRYRKPTPLLVPLDLVGRFVGSNGRKVQAWAAIYHDGVLIAEADGLFIEGRRADTPVIDPDLT